MICLCSPCARISQLAVSAPNEFGAIVLRQRPAGEKIAGDNCLDVTTDPAPWDSTVCVKELLSKIDQNVIVGIRGIAPRLSFRRVGRHRSHSQPVCSHGASAPSSLPARTRSLTWQCALESTASAASVRATTRRRVARRSCDGAGASTVLPRTVGRRGAPGRARSPDPWRVVVLQAASCAAPRRARAP